MLARSSARDFALRSLGTSRRAPRTGNSGYSSMKRPSRVKIASPISAALLPLVFSASAARPPFSCCSRSMCSASASRSLVGKN
ncbi:hypothetical protein D3C87_2065550 [compost metagenome]